MFIDILKTARVYHWVKNLVLFAALIFAQKYTDPDSVLLAAKGFVAFCLAASAIYFINDITDCRQDQLHPSKKNRPIASGQLSFSSAWIIALILLALGFLLSLSLGAYFLGFFTMYVLLNFGYNIGLKKIVIIDVMVLAVGFVIRAAAGAIAISVPISSWLLVCTILLALFLGFAKRRHELVVLGDNAISHRQSLAHYSPYFLDQMMSVVTASTVVAYTFYTLSPEIKSKLGTDNMVLTVPFVLYGIFRYLYLVHQKEKGGNPTKLLITDIPLLICVGLWIVAVLIILQAK
ncbi:MAG: decaprenyl-phosphate phosphoribosyltransferase [candidate division Zixibacteria bacterium]|nr:decaprenyl-phosphate phosphoribosyltransferase [candidate division Zixibacteria bacterium]